LSLRESPPSETELKRPCWHNRYAVTGGILFLLTIAAKFPLRHILQNSKGFLAIISGSLPSLLMTMAVFFFLWALLPRHPQRAFWISLTLGVLDEVQQALTGATFDWWDAGAVLLAALTCQYILFKNRVSSQSDQNNS